jgi:hypothetical protein
LRVVWSDLALTAAVAGTAGLGYAAGRVVEGDVARLLVSGTVTTGLWLPMLALAYRRRSGGAR